MPFLPPNQQRQSAKGKKYQQKQWTVKYEIRVQDALPYRVVLATSGDIFLVFLRLFLFSVSPVRGWSPERRWKHP